MLNQLMDYLERQWWVDVVVAIIGVGAIAIVLLLTLSWQKMVNNLTDAVTQQMEVSNPLTTVQLDTLRVTVYGRVIDDTVRHLSLTCFPREVNHD